MSKLTSKQVIESLKEMTILEINDLVKAIETEFGVSAAAPAAAGPVAAVEAPTEVTIKLIDAGANKVGVMKVVKEITGLGLMEAKALVDGVPSKIKEDIKPDEAAQLKKKFDEVGAKVEIA